MDAVQNRKGALKSNKMGFSHFVFNCSVIELSTTLQINLGVSKEMNLRQEQC